MRHQVVFNFIRKLMTKAAVQLAADPTAKLLNKHPDGPGVRKIEQLLKPASFFAANPGTPMSYQPGKRTRPVNLNVTPELTNEPGFASAGRTGGRGRSLEAVVGTIGISDPRRPQTDQHSARSCLRLHLPSWCTQGPMAIMTHSCSLLPPNVHRVLPPTRGTVILLNLL